jgi:hypothetical protein
MICIVSRIFGTPLLGGDNIPEFGFDIDVLILGEI